MVSGRRGDHPGRMAPPPGRRTRNGSGGSFQDHPGMANYPADDPDFRRTRRPPGMPSANRYLPPLGQEPPPERNSEPSQPRGSASGERITVTRAAAMRSREMGSRMYW